MKKEGKFPGDRIDPEIAHDDRTNRVTDQLQPVLFSPTLRWQTLSKNIITEYEKKNLPFLLAYCGEASGSI